MPFALLVPIAALTATAAPDLLDVGGERTFETRLEPGTVYVINFVSDADGSDAAAEFSTEGPAVLPMSIIHPRSDLTEQGGHLEVHCPGLAGHPLQVSKTSEALSSGRLQSNSSERGHFGFAFENGASLSTGLRVVVRTTRGRLAFTMVGIDSAETFASGTSATPRPGRRPSPR